MPIISAFHLKIAINSNAQSRRDGPSQALQTQADFPDLGLIDISARSALRAITKAHHQGENDACIAF